jgi:alpha-tubulin suppressor-like RCC1 family protein
VFSVVLTEQGEIYAWGSNNNGQMGTGEPGMMDSMDSEGAPKQVNLPMKICIEREKPSKFK